jgi:hypothetical protein
MRADDAEALLSAIRQLRGVVSVGGNVADVTEFMAIERARNDIKRQLVDAMSSILAPTSASR